MKDNQNYLLDSFMEFLSRIVKDAVAEAFKQQADKTPRYPEKVAIDLASEITGYTRNSLYQMHCRGQVPGAIKVGGKLLFDTATLKQWVEDGGRRLPSTKD